MAIYNKTLSNPAETPQDVTSALTISSMRRGSGDCIAVVHKNTAGRCGGVDWDQTADPEQELPASLCSSDVFREPGVSDVGVLAEALALDGGSL
ncbi:MAG: hypothetical protein FRX49_06202 [Trebouxia sp. A1-2]|nr:MAG: hypothetical protein FRX49_06202 [Trebouxia sp. A1-2]